MLVRSMWEVMRDLGIASRANREGGNGHHEILSPSRLWGFLTVVEHPQYGLFGGYLILNTAGRPLEFHCTAPIKPNRAQEILYGPTLESFLYGEQIGQTLISQGERHRRC